MSSFQYRSDVRTSGFFEVAVAAFQQAATTGEFFGRGAVWRMRAFRCFMRAEMDVLAAGNCYLRND